MKIGILQETKVPPDTRVALTPPDCAAILNDYPEIEFKIQSSATRNIKDDEYQQEGFKIYNDVSDCDILFNVKEVKISHLIPNKTYFMFSHTFKKQSYNRGLLQSILKNKIRLIDYELLTDDKGLRLVAFGRWAGIAGAYNMVHFWGKQSQQYEIPRLSHFKDLDDVRRQCFHENPAERKFSINTKGLKLVLTGDGRVASGSVELLEMAGLKRLTPEEFLHLSSDSDQGVYCQLPADKLFARDDSGEWNEGFFSNPAGYHSIFKPYLSKANALINGIYWDNRCAPLFTIKDMQVEDYSIKMISDITCDIAPVSSIPVTLRATTIAEPLLGFDRFTGQEIPAFSRTPSSVDVVAVDNLPNELPRDASRDFSRMLRVYVFPELIKEFHKSASVKSLMLERASITNENGELTKRFDYLQNFVDGLE